MLRLAATTAVSLGREATIIAWTEESAKSGELWVGGQFPVSAKSGICFFDDFISTVAALFTGTLPE